jgi:hypothetical protein
MTRRTGLPSITAASQLQRTFTQVGLQPLPEGTPGRASGADVGIADSDPITFFVIGDSGGIKAPGPQNAVSYASSAPAFVYSVGDIVYFNADPSEYQPQFYEAYGHLAAPIVAIPGNHDGDTTDDPSRKPLDTFMANFCTSKPAIPPADPHLEFGRHTQTQPYCDSAAGRRVALTGTSARVACSDQERLGARPTEHREVPMSSVPGCGRGSASDRPPHRARRTTLVACATAIAILGLATSPALANVGSVYFDANDNVGAGETFFNGSFTGFQNVGVGRSVMPNLAAASNNTAIGNDALFSNINGSGNVATGPEALYFNTIGSSNIATGVDALSQNTSGTANIATGHVALAFNTTGSHNIAVGSQAGQNLTTGSYNIDIANLGRTAESGTIRIGRGRYQKRAFLAGVSETPLSGSRAQPVLIRPNGRLGVAPAASAKSSAAKPLSATVSHLVATVKRQQRQIERLRKEVQGSG